MRKPFSIRLSAFVTSIALVSTFSASAAIELSGESKLEVTHDLRAERDATNTEGELLVTVDYINELTPALEFTASATAENTQLMMPSTDDDTGFEFFGKLQLAHASLGTLEAGNTGTVYGDAHVVTKIDDSKHESFFNPTVTGYKYSNTFGDLAVAAGFFGESDDGARASGFNLSANFALREDIDIKASMARFDDEDDAALLYGVEAVEFLPSLTLAANYYAKGLRRAAQSEAIYAAFDNTNLYIAAIRETGIATFLRLGGDFSFEVLPGFTAVTELRADTGQDVNTLFGQQAVRFWEGAEVFASLEKATGFALAPVVGASYNISF